jgi:hypothetical protein
VKRIAKDKIRESTEKKEKADGGKTQERENHTRERFSAAEQPPRLLPV